MNQGELIESVAQELGLTKALTKRMFETQASIIKSSLENQDCEEPSVALPGLGIFKVKNRAARIGRNPQTGASLQIKASRAPTFKGSSSLKSLFKNKKAEECSL